MKFLKAKMLAKRIKALEKKATKLSEKINAMLDKGEITKAQYNELAD